MSYIFPTINLNGTGVHDLIEQRCHAATSVRAALKGLQGMCPNARDYQTAPRGEYEKARAQYSAQFASLDKLLNEINDELDHLSQRLWGPRK